MFNNVSILSLNSCCMPAMMKFCLAILSTKDWTVELNSLYCVSTFVVRMSMNVLMDSS